MEPGSDCTTPWAAIRYRDLVALRNRLRDRYAPATVNLTLCAVRGTLGAAWLDGTLPESDYRRAVEVANVTGSRQPSGRALDHGELAALFRACSDDRSPAGGRDAAALALMFGAGLRRAEAAALDLADYDGGGSNRPRLPDSRLGGLVPSVGCFAATRRRAHPLASRAGAEPVSRGRGVARTADLGALSGEAG